MAKVYVWEVVYERTDGVATAPLVCLSVEYACAVVTALLAPGVTNIDRVTIYKRPPMGGEIDGIR